MKKIYAFFIGLFISITYIWAQPFVVIIDTVKVCNLNSGTLTTTVYNGTPPYSYNWSNGGSTASITVAPGVTTTYTCTVTDANTQSCTGLGTIWVQNAIPASAGPISGPTTPCEFYGVLYSVTNVHGVTYNWTSPGWTYSFPFNESTILMSVGPYGGLITVTPTNACGNGPSSNLSVNPIPYPAVYNSIIGPDTICSSPVIYSIAPWMYGINYIWSFPAGWTVVSGQNTATVTVAPGNSPGIVSVYAQNICGTSSAITLNVTGYTPLNLNVTNSNPTLCPGNCSTLEATGGSSYQWSNGLGAGSIHLVCPTVNTTYTVTAYGNNGCSASQATTIFVIPCTNIVPKAGMIFNDFNNNGVREPGETPRPNIIVQQDPFPYYFSSDVNGEYSAYWDTGSYNLWVPNFTPYTAYNPILHTITGVNDTSNDFAYNAWTYNDVRVNVYSTAARPGFPTTCIINFKNMGNDTAQGQVILDYDNLLSYVGCNPAFASHVGNVITWNYSNLLPGELRWNDVYLSVPAGAVLGDTVFYTADITPLAGDSVPANNHSEYCRIITMSNDPNDKLVSEHVLTPQQAANEPDLFYTVRFQNTGNDTAFKVVIRDLLSDKLIIPSLETVASSHPCTFHIEMNGTAVWTFDNIMLPDSGTDFDRSQGFVMYKIKVKNTLVQGDIIYNIANIYFDYNLPVPTNIVSTLIDAFVNVQEDPDNGKLEIAPNPARDQIKINYCDQNTTSLRLKIFNLSGQIVYDGNKESFIGRYTRSLSLADFAEGIYFIKLITEHASVSKKLVIIK